MEKIKLTKGYVKKQCLKNFLFSNWHNILIFVASLTFLIVCICIMAEKEFFTNIAAYQPLACFGLMTFAYTIYLLSRFKKLICVLRGKFYICSDEVVERKAPPKHRFSRKYLHAKDKFGYNEGPYYRLCFKTYGVHNLYRIIAPFEKGTVSPKERYDEAYLGDIYYVAVVRGEVVCAYNSKYYTIEK